MVNLGAVTVSGPSEVDGVTVQTVAVRVQVGAPWNAQWGGRQDECEAACLEAAHAALKIDGPQAYVGNVTFQDGGKVPTIGLRTDAANITNAVSHKRAGATYGRLSRPSWNFSGGPDDRQAAITDSS